MLEVARLPFARSSVRTATDFACIECKTPRRVHGNVGSRGRGRPGCFRVAGTHDSHAPHCENPRIGTYLRRFFGRDTRCMCVKIVALGRGTGSRVDSELNASEWLCASRCER